MISILYKKLLKPLLFRKDPEDVHDRFIQVGSFFGRFWIFRWVTKKIFFYQNQTLRQEIHGIKFDNPIGLSAGFDKDAKLINILPSIGFAYSQVGTVTYNAYEGNPKPRLTRLPKSEGVIVYYGLKNDGVEVISQRVKKAKNKQFPLGISIGKTNAQYTSSLEAGAKDYLDCLAYVIKEDIGHFYTINISCPNTFGGEPFTTPETLAYLLEQLSTLKINKPTFIKMPVDKQWGEFKELLKICTQYKFIKGVILSNLIKDRKIAKISQEEIKIAEKYSGGISGKPMQGESDKLIYQTYKEFGDKLTIIGVGGVFSAEDAYKKIKDGASLIQLITGMIFEGPTLIGEINRELVNLLYEDGFENVSQAIGANHTK